jgi:hypothetical protein
LSVILAQPRICFCFSVCHPWRSRGPAFAFLSVILGEAEDLLLPLSLLFFLSSLAQPRTCFSLLQKRLAILSHTQEPTPFDILRSAATKDMLFPSQGMAEAPKIGLHRMGKDIMGDPNATIRTPLYKNA